MAIDYPPISTPTARDRLREWRTPLQMLQLLGNWHTLPRAQASQTRNVLLVPGFGASAGSMVALAKYLRQRGHRVFDWGLGRNTGNVPALLEGTTRRAAELSAQFGEPLVGLGWSLGGYLAREAARDLPEAFDKIVTLASPVIGGPKFTLAANWYRARGWDVDHIERAVADRFATPLQVPITALYSKRDGVVAWEACIDHWSPNVEHVEVDATHLAMGFSPEVLTIVGGEVG